MDDKSTLEQVIAMYNERGLGQTFGELRASPAHRLGTSVRYALAELVDNWQTGKTLGEQHGWLREEVRKVYNAKKVM